MRLSLNGPLAPIGQAATHRIFSARVRRVRIFVRSHRKCTERQLKLVVQYRHGARRTAEVGVVTCDASCCVCLAKMVIVRKQALQVASLAPLSDFHGTSMTFFFGFVWTLSHSRRMVRRAIRATI